MGGIPAAAALLLITQGLAGAPGPERVLYPDVFPDKCLPDSHRFETVVVDFSTSALGEPVGPVIVSATNDCLRDAALTALGQARFLQTGASARLHPQRNLRASIVFDRIKSPLAPERTFRRSVKKRLDRVLKALTKNDDPARALEKLDVIEKKYGGEFSLAELAAHRLLRATARSELGDLEGALEDLRAADKTGLIDEISPMTGMSVSEIREALKQSQEK